MKAKSILISLKAAECHIANKNHMIVLADNVELATPAKCYLYCDETSENDYPLYYPTCDTPISTKGYIFGECICCENDYTQENFTILHISEIKHYGIMFEHSDHLGYTPEEFFHKESVVVPRRWRYIDNDEHCKI